MNSRAWIGMLEDLFEGLSICLPDKGATDPGGMLEALLEELPHAWAYRAEFEEKVERIIESDPVLKKAASEYLGGQANAAMTAARHSLRKARAMLRKDDGN